MASERAFTGDKVDEIKKNKMELKWIPVGQLDENPNNWRLHPKDQLEGLEAVLSEIGWVGALIYNTRTKRLIDGHARRAKVEEQLGKETAVPVLCVDIDEADELKALATYDPIGAMAIADQGKLNKLLESTAATSGGLNKLLDEIGSQVHDLFKEEGNSKPNPVSVTEYKEANVQARHKCPSCGFEWN